MIIYKSYVLSYPDATLACDVCLLFLLAALEALRLFFGVKGNLMEENSYVIANLFLTGTTIVLAVYYLAWQAYVLRADAIISSILLVAYGLSGLLASITVTRFVSAYS
ncbi:transmembrane protein 80-like isoform X2 [Thalassophryne amazonica]|uniref:transmembrane protein 80-like isoform X2 n=1 Tax=Thalassophryne amazonica TaxID=390379 RepID=UPI001471725E|nr:transmembrane protein 80-like isoform X2 [Thalassophryne amazonica]